MKNILLYFFMLAACFEAIAGVGPTNIGSISIGMSKTEYIAAIGTDPVDCDTYRDKYGKSRRSEMKYLDPEEKTLCRGYGYNGKDSVENIQVSGLSYYVIESNYPSGYMKSLGHSSKAIFLKDRLISLEIYAPKVSLEILTGKYGSPKIVDNRKTEVCMNRMGNEFKNEVGNLDAVWINGNVRAILRNDTSSPSRTCSDGLTLQYYILEEPKQVKIIEGAINKYQRELSKNAIKANPF